MIKIIAIILLIAGAALVIAGVLIFILSDLRAVLKDLSTTRKLETDSGIDDAVQEAYYSESYAPDAAEEKPKMKGFIRRKGSQSRETSPLKSSEAESEQNIQDERAGRSSQTQPLETLREILSEAADTQTAPLATSSDKKQEDERVESDTLPLSQVQQISETQPLRQLSSSETQPLIQKSAPGTQPFKGFARQKNDTKPL